MTTGIGSPADERRDCADDRADPGGKWVDLLERGVDQRGEVADERMKEVLEVEPPRLKERKRPGAQQVMEEAHVKSLDQVLDLRVRIGRRRDFRS